MSSLFPRVLAILTTTPERWRSITGMLPADLLLEKPLPEEWSAMDCLQHLIDTESVFQSRLTAFREGRDFPAFDPDTQGTVLVDQLPEALVETFASQRAISLLRLDSFSPADLNLRARHAELGMVNLEQLINEWAAHDLNHTVQAERALMQPFLRECGPWQKYFTDHLLSDRK